MPVILRYIYCLAQTSRVYYLEISINVTICCVGGKVVSLKKQPGEVFTLKEIEEVSNALKHMQVHDSK